MELVTYLAGRRAPRVGIHRREGIVDLAALARAEGKRAPADMLSLLKRGPSALQEIERMLEQGVPAEATTPDTKVQLLAPVPRPGKIFALAQNYAEHVSEGGAEVRPKSGRVPLVFCKLPSSVIGPGAPILIPDMSTTVDWEVELAVIIGSRAHKVSVEQAASVIAGYSVFNDVSARYMTYPARTQFGSLEEWFDFINGKWCDSFSVLGPSLVTGVKDPDNLNLKLSVNAVVRQNASTADMIFKVPEVIAFISRWSTLEPGDVIATGTPSGVGDTTGTYLQPGDEMVSTIEGLGSITNPVQAG
jgi:2-keto-4-pentenoate hydratase/2-oxohepta-3-ene-1,7-dioic acid hydratase in catechol pathway